MLIITILSLLMAATMGWLALRLLREEQRRSEARVAALTAALDDPWGSFVPKPVSEHDAQALVRPVDVQPAWTETRSVEAPTVARAAAPQPATPQIVNIDAHDMTDTYFASATASDDYAPVHSAGAGAQRAMFGDVEAETSPRDDRRWLAIAAAVLVALGIISVLWSTSGSSQEATTAKVTAVAPSGGVPVELLSLGHERTASGLVVRGLVRNPTAGSTRTATAASVFLFDQAGGFLGSGRSVLDTPTLTPGDQAAFEVTLPGNANVRRYRVTFRGMDGTVVPHVDKRPSSRPSSGSGL